MRNQIFFMVFVTILVLTGCAPAYNISPKYYDDPKIAVIDSYRIEKIKYYDEQNRLMHNLTVNQTKKLITSDGPQCERILSIESSLSGRGWYFTTTVRDDTLSQYGNKCKVTQISNIDFIECTDIQKYQNGFKKDKQYYFITSSTQTEKTKLTVDKKCFYNLKDYFEKITQPQYIKIVKPN